MLNTVEVVNSQGETLVLELENDPSGVWLKGIEGTDPVKATLVSSGFANMDGAQYHSSRRESRNLKMTLGLDPDFSVDTIRTLRNQIYRFFMPKTEVLIRFRILNEFDPNTVTQNLIRQITARIESCETPHFAKDPAVDVSMICFDPDFVDPIPGLFNGMSAVGWAPQVINYEGTVENGFILSFLANRTVNSFTIYLTTPDGVLRSMDFTAPLINGDVVTIDTVAGEKSVTLTRAGVESSLLYALTPQSPWLEFHPGENQIQVYALGAPVPYYIEYMVKYGGL